MQLMIKKIGFVFGTFLFALLGICMIFVVTQASAANLAEPGAPENPLNEYPSTWVVVVGYTGTLHMVNTASDIVYGPFLTGALGTSTLLDVAVTPNGKTALVSNFGNSVLAFVDISNPISPSLMTTVTMVYTYHEETKSVRQLDGDIITDTMPAEDIAITQDGKYAIVTDGGLSSAAVVVDIAAQKVVTGSYLGANDAQAVAIAPNGTVIFADYFGGALHSYLLDDTGNLTYMDTYTYMINEDTSEISPTGVLTTGWYLPWPINVNIAPNGETVIFCDAFPYTNTSYTDPDYNTPLYQVGVYRIVAPGVLSFTQAIVGLTSGNYQSIAFSATGDKAYMFGNNGENYPYTYNRISVFDITGPGEISLNTEIAAEIPRYASGAFFGVDSIAVINNKAYLGHETTSLVTDTLPTSVHVVDLNTFNVVTLTLPGVPTTTMSVGVAAVPYFIYLPSLLQP
ncbi:MAG: hypothetical protein JW908_17150 [Anaerolineales bacterium]|nr:hypothetical protein [Anaerolineales bacterium]